MCQSAGSLDYLVALDVNSNEVRVLRLYYDNNAGTSTVKDYTKVDRDET